MTDAAVACPLNPEEIIFSKEAYQKDKARWCPGCGDHAVLNAVQRLAYEKQLPPEKTVVVSGIGCSSRFPHYMNTYGFHGLHGRAFPVAEGIKFRRPDLHLFVVTGDGDCCSIGAGAWIHAIRYNINMTVLLFDNQIYGMTKKQTSPTTPLGTVSNTHPLGSVVPPVNPIQTTLGVANASFVAQTVDWAPGHLFETIKLAHEHEGFSFVRILMRCPKFMPEIAKEYTSHREYFTILEHQEGIQIDERTRKYFSNFEEHNPQNLDFARNRAQDNTTIFLGLFYRNTTAGRYDNYGSHNLEVSPEVKVKEINKLLDKFSI